MSYYPNHVYSLFAFTSFILVIIALPWHLSVWNAGITLFMLWTAVGCLIQFINSIIWNGNTINWAPTWCDICVKIFMGLTVALPASSLCITHRLYRISQMETIHITKAEKRHTIIVDLMIGLGIPVLGMILWYIPQNNRFSLYEDIGCLNTYYPTPLSIALSSAWPVVIGCVAAIYSALSIRAFWGRREQLLDVGLNADRYTRLMCLSGVGTLFTIPIGSYLLYLDISNMGPWISWDHQHANFSHIDEVPASVWHSDLSFEFNRWWVIICALVSFACFGLGADAIARYRYTAEGLATYFSKYLSNPLVRITQRLPGFARVRQEAGPPLSVPCIYTSPGSNQTKGRRDSEKFQGRRFTGRVNINAPQHNNHCRQP